MPLLQATAGYGVEWMVKSRPLDSNASASFSASYTNTSTRTFPRHLYGPGGEHKPLHGAIEVQQVEGDSMK
ncbi:MAG: hypothetical protein HY645_15600 [Acidobacteria bacterium]|nr:hypothetical protein [Acidobacteriota bacterium]